MKPTNLAGLLTCGILGCNLANAGLETAVKEYSQAGHALVIVDMQPDFLFMVPMLELAEELPYQIEVIRAVQRQHIPVFVLEDERAESTIPELMEVVDDMAYEVITKPFGDGFMGTNLDNLLT